MPASSGGSAFECRRTTTAGRYRLKASRGIEKQVDWPTPGDNIGAYGHLYRWRARVAADAIEIETASDHFRSTDASRRHLLRPSAENTTMA